MESAFFDGDFFHHVNKRTWVNNIAYDVLARDAAIQPVHDAMMAFMQVAGQNGTSAAQSVYRQRESFNYVQAALDYAIANGFTMGTGANGNTDLMLLGVNLNLYELAPRPIMDGIQNRPAVWPPAHFIPLSIPPQITA